MRTTLLLLALTTGCFFGDGPEVFDPGGGPATRPDAGAVVDASAPVPVDACTFGCWAAVELGATFPFGNGTEYRHPWARHTQRGTPQHLLEVRCRVHGTECVPFSGISQD